MFTVLDDRVNLYIALNQPASGRNVQKFEEVLVDTIFTKEHYDLLHLTQDAGYRSVIWDATNDYGKPVSAGIYLYQIQAGEYMQTKKMVLLK